MQPNVDEAALRDLSENAKVRSGQGTSRRTGKSELPNLQNALANARVLDEKNVDLSKVHILSTVTVFNHRSGKEVKYTIVSASEADFNQGKISIDSPIGAALMGKKIGDSVEIQVPAGTLTLDVKNIERL